MNGSNLFKILMQKNGVAISEEQSIRLANFIAGMISVHEFIKKDRDDLRAKLAAMESQRFNVKEFIRRCQDQWDFDVKIASKMLEIAKHVPTVPADNPAAYKIDDGTTSGYVFTDHQKIVELEELYGVKSTPLVECKPARITEKDVREIADNVMEFNYDHKHSVDYWMIEEGYYLLNKLNADREQLSAVAVYDLSPANVEGKIRDRLIAMGWTPPGSPAVAVPENIQLLIDRARKWGVEHTGCEPSLSCFHQSLDELVDAMLTLVPSRNQQSMEE